MPASMRLNLEPLDDRTLPAIGLFASGGTDAVVVSPRLATPNIVAFDYATSGETGPVLVGVYHSADPFFDPSDELVGGTAVAPRTGGTAFAPLFTGELPTDLGRKFVLVVADPFDSVAETVEFNNTAFFRKFAVGAVVHGFSLSGGLPPWLFPAAATVQAQGYDLVIPYVWAPLSQSPTPGGPAIAAEGLANMLRTLASFVGPNDVVDLHLIGHSRGSGVVSQTFMSLVLNPGPRQLQLGYYRETLLDPHVAGNNGPLELGLAELAIGTGFNPVGGFSYDPAGIGRTVAAGVLNFQAGSQDPPAFFAPNVDQPEVVFQQLAWDATTPDSVERLIGLNFLPPPVVAIPNLSGRLVAATDISSEGIGHIEVPDWYLANAVPALGG